MRLLFRASIYLKHTPSPDPTYTTNDNDKKKEEINVFLYEISLFAMESPNYVASLARYVYELVVTKGNYNLHSSLLCLNQLCIYHDQLITLLVSWFIIIIIIIIKFVFFC